MEVVPKNWLLEDKDITKCYWPNVASHKVRKMCVRYHKPSSQWKTYTVQVMYETSKEQFYNNGILYLMDYLKTENASIMMCDIV